MADDKVEVWMGSDVARLVGHTWPMHAGAPLSMAAVETPAVVTVHMPGGAKLTLPTKLLTMTQEGGKVVDVSLNVSAQPRTFEIALTEANDVATTFAIALTPESRDNMARWRKDIDALKATSGPYVITGAPIDQSVTPHVVIRSHVPSGLWFVVLDLTTRAP